MNLEWFSKLFGRRVKRTSPLREELNNLHIAYHKTEARLSKMADAFWKSGGTCCPSCGCPGYSSLVLKQERRRQRINQLHAKLNRDGNTNNVPGRTQ